MQGVLVWISMVFQETLSVGEECSSSVSQTFEPCPELCFTDCPTIFQNFPIPPREKQLGVGELQRMVLESVVYKGLTVEVRFRGFSGLHCKGLYNFCVAFWDACKSKSH